MLFCSFTLYTLHVVLSSIQLNKCLVPKTVTIDFTLLFKMKLFRLKKKLRIILTYYKEALSLQVEMSDRQLIRLEVSRVRLFERKISC